MKYYLYSVSKVVWWHLTWRVGLYLLWSWVLCWLFCWVCFFVFLCLSPCLCWLGVAELLPQRTPFHPPRFCWFIVVPVVPQVPGYSRLLCKLHSAAYCLHVLVVLPKVSLPDSSCLVCSCLFFVLAINGLLDNFWFSLHCGFSVLPTHNAD